MKKCPRGWAIQNLKVSTQLRIEGYAQTLTLDKINLPTKIVSRGASASSVCPSVVSDSLSKVWSLCEKKCLQSWSFTCSRSWYLCVIGSTFQHSDVCFYFFRATCLMWFAANIWVHFSTFSLENHLPIIIQWLTMTNSG